MFERTRRAVLRTRSGRRTRPLSYDEPAGPVGDAAGSVVPEKWPAVLDSALHSGLRLVLVSRDGCHLCEQVELTVSQRLADDQWLRLDVDADAELKARLGDHVPVTFVDSRLLAYWTLEAEVLDAALAGRPRPAPPAL